MTLKDAYNYCVYFLSANGVDEAEFKALCLVCNADGIKNSEYETHKEDTLMPKALADNLWRLKCGEPLQYVLGKWDFYESEFYVGKGVLIPRPETEELTALVVDENKEKRPSKIIDIGTGSGCIAITLAHHFPDCRVEGWDISADALRIAEKNNRDLGTRVTFLQRDILHYTPPTEEHGSCDLIVSNPPYIVPSEMADMEPQVLDHEPHTALFVPENDPLLFYRAIAITARQLLHPGGKLYLEINPLFATATADRLRAEGFGHVTIIRDLSNRERFVTATR